MSKQMELYFGRLGRDPEVKQTKSSESLCLFRIACPTEEENGPLWKNVAVWGSQANVAGLCLKRGSKVFVQGITKIREYRDKNGEAKSYEEVNACHVGFVNS